MALRNTASPIAIRHGDTGARPVPEATLIARVRAGDREALDAIFRDHYPALCTFVAGYVQSLETAEEIVQDVFFSIWVHRHDWDVRGELRAYLFGAARNRALGHLRHRRVTERWAAATARDPADVAQPPARPDHLIQTKELAAALARAVAALPDRRREAYQLRWEHGLSYADIARVMGITVKGVDATLNKTLSTLREMLEPFF